MPTAHTCHTHKTRWGPHCLTGHAHPPRRHLSSRPGSQHCCCTATEGLCTSTTTSTSGSAHILSVLPPSTQWTSTPQSMFNPVSLAYLGDAVWEVFVRQHIWQQLAGKGGQPGAHPSTKQLHDAAAKWANASQQATLFDLLTTNTKTSKTNTNTSDGTSTLAASSTSTAGTPLLSKDLREPAYGQEASSIPEQVDGQNHSPATEHSLTAVAASQLTEAELDLLRWAKNSSAVTVPKGVDSNTYKKATALEVLVAHLYLTDRERCAKLVDTLLLTQQSRSGKVSKQA